MNRKYIILQFWFLFFLLPTLAFGQSANDYLKVIKEDGIEPVKFVQQKLQEQDLIIFDDALHNAVEPFEFYQQLIKQNKGHFKYLFLEVVGINNQEIIDSFLNSSTKDSTILFNVFQDDFSGYGWRYKTYYDLFMAVRNFNKNIKDEDKKIKVIAVDQPVFWSGIHTRKDYNDFQQSLIARDYFMYKIILQTMKGFKNSEKGIFLTNTRHAYKNIRTSDGELYWNCGTFFHQWHPDITYSIRIHNATLSIEREVEGVKNASTAGMEKLKFSWIRMDNGLWDKAFELNRDIPVAFSLDNNVFGQTAYVGNHMLNVEKGQTMYDAYDALLFLGPLDNLHFSATIDFIYTYEFKTELKRRLKLLYGHDLESVLAEEDCSNLDEYIEHLSVAQPMRKNQFLSE